MFDLFSRNVVCLFDEYLLSLRVACCTHDVQSSRGVGNALSLYIIIGDILTRRDRDGGGDASGAGENTLEGDITETIALWREHIVFVGVVESQVVDVDDQFAFTRCSLSL